MVSRISRPFSSTKINWVSDLGSRSYIRDISAKSKTVKIYLKMINFNSSESNEAWLRYLHEKDSYEEGLYYQWNSSITPFRPKKKQSRTRHSSLWRRKSPSRWGAEVQQSDLWFQTKESQRVLGKYLCRTWSWDPLGKKLLDSLYYLLKWPLIP